MRDDILEQLNSYTSNNTEQFENYLKEQFEPTIEQHINGISKYLEKYKVLLSEGKKSNQLKQEDKQKLRDSFTALDKKITNQANDINVVKEGINT
jgi:uncharacterized coiled-coil DUF342 family protein